MDIAITAINNKVSDPAPIALNTNTDSNAAITLAFPLAPTAQNTNNTFIPDKAEVIVPLPPPAPGSFIPPPAVVDTSGVATIPASPIVPPIERTSEVTVPDNTIATVPDPTQDIIPPLAAFNIMGGESIVINPAPKEDTSGIGGHGEVEAVSPPQPALNNVLEKPAQAKFANSEMSSRGYSTGKSVRDYLRTIRKRAQATDREFQRQHLPYRFKVLTDNNENVLIDLSILDGQGKVVKHETRNVTNDNFGKLMDDISTGKGLLIDDLPQG
jgi:hypothetical protein